MQGGGWGGDEPVGFGAIVLQATRFRLLVNSGQRYCDVGRHRLLSSNGAGLSQWLGTMWRSKKYVALLQCYGSWRPCRGGRCGVDRSRRRYYLTPRGCPAMLHPCSTESYIMLTVCTCWAHVFLFRGERSTRASFAQRAIAAASASEGICRTAALLGPVGRC